MDDLAYVSLIALNGALALRVTTSRTSVDTEFDDTRGPAFAKVVTEVSERAFRCRPESLADMLG